MPHAYDQRFDVTGNLENFCELNKALVHPEIQKVFKIPCHIESCGTCISIKYRQKQKLITQFDCKSRDESFDSS